MRATICDICKQMIETYNEQDDIVTSNLKISITPVESRVNPRTLKEEYYELRSLDICNRCANKLIEAVKNARY